MNPRAGFVRIADGGDEARKSRPRAEVEPAARLRRGVGNLKRISEVPDPDGV